MEFFKIVDVLASEEQIQEQINLQNLERFCKGLFPLEQGTEFCRTGGMWGEFTVRHDRIMGGVRFSMLDCPNALAWTITTGYPPARERIVIHLTINRERKQEEFIEELHEFLEDLHDGLLDYFSRS